MNYIYDILLNLNLDKVYDYYEWKENDNIEYVKKIPIFKISTKRYLKLINNKFRVCKEFLNKIYNQTEVYERMGVKTEKYITLLTDGKEIMAFEFNKDGILITTSKLQVDEEVEVLESIFDLEENNINFEIIEKRNSCINFLTRNEAKRNKYLISELKKIYSNNEYEKLKYLYYEIGIKISELKKEHPKILEKLNNSWDDDNENLYNLLTNLQ